MDVAKTFQGGNISSSWVCALGEHFYFVTGAENVSMPTAFAGCSFATQSEEEILCRDPREEVQVLTCLESRCQERMVETSVPRTEKEVHFISVDGSSWRTVRQTVPLPATI